MSKADPAMELTPASLWTFELAVRVTRAFVPRPSPVSLASTLNPLLWLPMSPQPRVPAHRIAGAVVSRGNRVRGLWGSYYTTWKS